MRQIYAAPLGDAELAALYAYPAEPWLRANMVASVDGAASLSGVTKGLSSTADKRLFALLRTLADVIVVGAATVRAENYAPVRQHELWPDLRPGRSRRPRRSRSSPRTSTSTRPARSSPTPRPGPAPIIITTAQAPADRRAALEGQAELIVAGQDRAWT